jgi:hypothetical protein
MITVGAAVGGIFVGRAADVWAAWVKTRPGSGVGSPKMGRLQAAIEIAKRNKLAKVRSVDDFISFSLKITK